MDMTWVARNVYQRYVRAAIDFTDVTPREIEQLVKAVASDVTSMSDADVAYGAYAADSLLNPDLKPLRAALTMEYRKRLLTWFSGALKARAQQGGGGQGIKRLKDGVADYIESLPSQLVTGYKPMSTYIKGNITDIVDPTRLDAASVKIFRVLRDEVSKSSRTAKTTFEAEWDNKLRVWFIPPTPETYPIKQTLLRAGFQWNPTLRRWEVQALTPKALQVVHPPRPLVSDTEAMEEWFYGKWLPKNLHRFETVFNTFIKSDETSYAFEFELRGRTVQVKVTRDLKGPRDAIEELRYRYLGRQGREPWLEVLDKYVELTRTKTPDKVMPVIDRMNNLQHSNGMFMEHFPSSVQSWYGKFLDRKYSARDAFTLAGFIQDSDLRDILRWFDPRSEPLFRDRGQGSPDIPIEVKTLPKGINWRERGYPREKGYKQPSRQSPDVQRGLYGLPESWT